MATSFVAGIASTLTASNNNSKTITSLNEIDSEKKVAVPSISRLSDNIRANGGKPIEVSDIDEALKYLNEGKIDAIVYDIIPLEYIYNKLDKKEYVLTTNGLYKQNYGFVFPNNSDIRREINLQILAMKESDEIPQIIDLWVNRE
jgi:polar amino acid transport system substrate-binding protein